MNGSNITPHLLRFIGLVVLQALLLNQMTTSVGAWFNVLLYPLFILFLPLQLTAPYLVMLGFAVGFAVDAASATWGMHASAAAFSGFMRGLALAPFAPKGGFSAKDPIFAPAHVGWQTFLNGATLFMALHLLWFFSVSYFSHHFAWEIILDTATGTVLTMIFVGLYVMMFNPKR
jgi:hypothetical protein